MKISLMFVPVNNIQAFVDTMAWHRSCDKPLYEQWCLIYWRIYASLGLNELNYLSWKEQDIHFNEIGS